MEEELDEGRFSSKALEDFRLIDMAVAGDDKAYAKLLQRYKRPRAGSSPRPGRRGRRTCSTRE